MASCAAARSLLRSTTARYAVPRFSAATKPKSNPFFQSSFNLPKQNTLSAPRILRSPVELSCCVESLMPNHSATASALVTSMLSASPSHAGWAPEGKGQIGLMAS